MTVEIKHDFSAYATPIIAVWYDNLNPVAEVGRAVLTPPHTAGEVLIVQGLKATVYQFKFYLSTDGASLQTLLHSWFVDASKVKGSTIEFYHYIVGRGQSGTDDNGTWADPAAGAVQISDTRLKDQTFEVSHRMIGIRPKSSYVVLSAGGFSLVDGEKFEDGDHWVTIVTREVQLDAPASSGGSLGIKVVTASETLNDGYYNNTNVAAFTVLIGTTIFPAFNTLPDCVLRFAASSGTQRYWKLQFATGNTVRYAGKDRNAIYLNTDEWIEITIKQGTVYVTGHDTRYRMAGQVFGGGKELIGTVLADGGGGQEYDVADYPRMIEELAAHQTCSYADYNLSEVAGSKTYFKNRGKFAISADGTKFKFPDLRGYSPRFLKIIAGADATRFGAGPMSLQKEGVNLSNITIEVHDGQGGSSTNPIAAGNGGVPAGLAGMDSFRAWENNKRNGVEQWFRLSGDTETRVDNYGELPLIGL